MLRARWRSRRRDAAACSLLAAFVAFVVLQGTASAAKPPAPTPLAVKVHSPGFKAYSFVAGPNGSLWFRVSGSVVALRSASGQIQQFPLSLGSGSITAIGAGPDKSLWFTFDGACDKNLIGRVDASGAVTTFPVPDPPMHCLSGQTSIAVGSDGNLWLVSPAGNVASIDRLTPSGTLTRFPLAGFNWTVIPGPDGNIWYPLRGTMGRISPDGTVLRGFPTGSTCCTAIAAGPKGTVWFGGYKDGLKTPIISRMTKTGAVKHFRLVLKSNTRGRTVESIARGADGAMWFTLAKMREIGRITASGELTWFRTSVPALDAGGAHSTAMTSDTRGILWYSTSDGRLASFDPKKAARPG